MTEPNQPMAGTGASQNPEREERILNAAAELIVHYGYDKTTVDDIARAAHVSKGAIYLHFKSKEELVETLILREFEVLLDDVIARLGKDPAGVTVFSLYRHSLQGLAENKLLRALYTNDRRIFGDFMRRVKSLPIYNQTGMFGVEFVRGFQEAGLFRKDLDPRAAAFLLIAIRYGFLYMDDDVLGDQTPPLDAIGDTLADMLHRSLAPEQDEKTDQKLGNETLMLLLERGREALRQWREAVRQQNKKGETK